MTTSYLVRLRFEADGPAVEGEWALPGPAEDRYTEWVGLYTKDPKVEVHLIEKTGARERVLRTWTAQRENTP
ncbi:hypothetical protein [Streptomyces sp. NPDC058295]|jgi:hypothetical protein|uniref:hypothetical protein n=1 Tax=Streptomyces sp. NPDC058295 TaxID=3346431 RepID=UPI0036F14BD4